MDDIAIELAKLHVLSGAEFSRQVERIALRKEFHPLEGEIDIFIAGGEQRNDFDNLLNAARKAVEHGYRVFILPNLTTEYNTRLLTSDIKKYFESNPHALEVMLFKGKKRISIVRRYTMNPAFYAIFKKLYEQ